MLNRWRMSWKQARKSLCMIRLDNSGVPLRLKEKIKHILKQETVETFVNLVQNKPVIIIIKTSLFGQLKFWRYL